MPDFVHLHCHTEYSLLDGAIRLDDLCAKAKDLGMSAVAITDHGNLYGALHFYVTARKFGLKPIIGCEVYVCHDHTDKSSERARERNHLVLLAKNKEGYHNLVKLATHGALHGFYMRPRVDKALLREYSEGLIALSACIAGEVPRTFTKQGMDAALEVAAEYADIYPGRFYLELQSNGLALQEKVNDALIEIGRRLSLPLVATNDCHYLNADDADAHDVLLCIQTQSLVSDEKRMRFETRDLYYKTPEEMEAAFARLPEALENTARIAGECEDYAFDFKTYHFPLYELPDGTTPEQEFRRLSRAGLARRLEKMPPDTDRKVYEDRLELELDVICDMGFPGYFLIVQDFINWAKDQGIPVGPGRGSAAGSLVAYALRITNLDPLPYNLLFERFLNAERISMPDIDVDFCEEKRQQVIEYVARKYGSDSVAQISTFNKMLAKGVVRDVGRALGMNFQETDRITKLIPSALGITIKKAMEQEPALADLYAGDPVIKNLLDTAMRLEGLSRNSSVHAAGLVISDRPMRDYLPLTRGKQEEDVVTQFDMKMVEKVGLVKFDFLGLRNMTVIDDALKIIAAQGKTPPDLDTLPLDDPRTYKLYADGNTDGIFQVESSGMRQYLRQLRPTVFEDIIAMLALYRPGPLGADMVSEFIKRKHGQIKVVYPHDSLKGCLKDTYGVIVYQEQVMQIAQIIGGYTLGGADLLRRAMGKKDPAAMSAERSKFVRGAEAGGVASEKANEIFNLMEKFAEYGFNKSHSAAYALISYHTAYLKTHYPTEFMAALLSSEMGNQEKLLKYVASCRDLGVTILPPSVQASRWKFTVRDGGIAFSLGAFKNVGQEAVRAIVEAREKDGPFTSLLDLCCRVPLRRVTKRVLENLIKGGACDCFGVSRAGLLASLEAVMSRAQKRAKAAESKQVSLFSLAPAEEARLTAPGVGFDCPEQGMPEWASDLLAKFEKEALGFFFSNHPLLLYRREMPRLGLMSLEDVRELGPGTAFKCAALVTSVREFFDRKNRRWGLAQLEDVTAQGTCFCFADVYADARPTFVPDVPLYLEGRVSRSRDGDEPDPVDGEEAPPKEVKFTCEKVMPLEEACAESLDPVHIELAQSPDMDERLDQLKALLEKHRGRAEVEVVLHLGDKWCRMRLGPGYTVQGGGRLLEDLSAWEEAG